VAQPLGGEASRRAEAHAWYAAAAGYERTEAYAEACEAYRHAMECDPGEERAVLGAAAMLARQQRSREALELAEDWLAEHPRSARALFWLGRFYTETGETERAVGLLTRLCDIEPDDETNWAMLGAAVAGRYEGEGNEGREAEALREVSAVLEKGIAAAPPGLVLHRLAAKIFLAAAEDAEPEDRLRDLDEAIRHLTVVAETEPGDGALWEIIGSLHLRAERYEAALDAFGKALELRPEDAELRERILLTRFRMAGAGGAPEEDDAPGPDGLADDAETCIRHGKYLLRNRMPEKAAESFRRATELEPENPEGWLCSAALQFRQGGIESAVETLEDAAVHIPGNRGILEMLGGFKLSLGRYGEAVELFQRVADLHAELEEPEPFEAGFCNNFALACTHLRRLDEAARWLVRGLEADPELHLRYIALALNRSPSRTLRKNVVSVLRRVEKETNRENAALPIARGALLMDAGEPASAVGAFREAMDIMEKYPLEKANNLNARFLYWYGVALDLGGDTGAGLEMIRQSLELDPNQPQALNHLAYTWAERDENLEQALAYSQRSIAGGGENPAFLDTLGWIHFKLGNIAEACLFLRKADRMRSGDETISDHLRQALERAAELGIDLPPADAGDAAAPADGLLPDDAGDFGFPEDEDGLFDEF
jgi:tetratricopeptide (TPR) repeat protein